MNKPSEPFDKRDEPARQENTALDAVLRAYFRSKNAPIPTYSENCPPRRFSRWTPVRTLAAAAAVLLVISTGAVVLTARYIQNQPTAVTPGGSVSPDVTSAQMTTDGTAPEGSSTRPESSEPPVSLEEFVQTLPLYSQLTVGVDTVRPIVTQMLLSQPVLAIPSDYFRRETDPNIRVETVNVDMQNMTRQQYEALGELLIAATFADKVLNNYASPENLSQLQLCDVRDSCYALVDALEKGQNFQLVVDGQECNTINIRLDLYSRLDTWAETYCPVDEKRRFEEDHEIISRCYIMELKNEAQPYLDQLDAVKAAAEAGEISYNEAYDQIWSIWNAYVMAKNAAY